MLRWTIAAVALLVSVESDSADFASTSAGIGNLQSDIGSLISDYKVAKASIQAQISAKEQLVSTRTSTHSTHESTVIAKQAARALAMQYKNSNETEKNSKHAAWQTKISESTSANATFAANEATRNGEIASNDGDIASVTTSLGSLSDLLSYSEAQTAKALLEARKSALQARNTELVAQSAAELATRNAKAQAKRDAEAAEKAAANAFSISSSQYDDAISEETTAKNVRASSGSELKSAISELKQLRQQFKTTQTANDVKIKEFRTKLDEVSKEIEKQSVSARTAAVMNGNGQFVNIPSINLRTTFTMEAWIYFDPRTNSRKHLPVISQSRVDGGDHGKQVFQLKLRGGDKTVEASNSGQYTYYFFNFLMGSPDASIKKCVQMYGKHFQPSGWHHVAVSVDGSNKARLYQDGELQQERQLSGNRWSSSLPIQVGRKSDSAGVQFMDGKVDELRIWNYARTIGEINTSMKLSLEDGHEKLRSYYRFDETGDDTRAIDSGASRLDGTFEGGATHAESFAFSNANDLFLDSGSSVFLSGDLSNYITVPKQNFQGAFTLEGWFKYDPTNSTYLSGKMPKIAFPVTDGSRELEFVFTLRYRTVHENGQDKFYWYFSMGRSDSESYAIRLYSAKVTSPNKDWQHVAVSMDPNGLGTLYVTGLDGQQTSTQASVEGTRFSSDLDIQIGRFNDINGASMQSGDVDEIRIWNYARTASQVSAHSKRNIKGSETGLLAMYSLNEPVSSSRVVDGSVNLAEGKFHGSRKRNPPVWAAV